MLVAGHQPALIRSATVFTQRTQSSPDWPEHYEYLGNYPNDRENGWSDELQGVAHDSAHWYFTQRGRLWKFPVTHDLNTKVNAAKAKHGILTTRIPSPLRNDGYNHFGDPDYYRGVLLVPTEGERWKSIGDTAVHVPIVPVVAVFRASDLRYLGHLQLPLQKHAGWCAVQRANGRLYSSDGVANAANPIRGYSVSWALVTSGQLPVAPSQTRRSELSRFQLAFPITLRLLDEGGDPLSLKHMQGGEFSDNDHLFTVNGFYKGDTKDTGIMGFDLASGRRMVRSTNGCREFDVASDRWVVRATNGCRDFNFEYHPGVPKGEEPEGITIWDRDADSLAPGIGGQIHVIMLDNDPDADDLYFKHYRVTDKRKL